jgi:hypothetical protein
MNIKNVNFIVFVKLYIYIYIYIYIYTHTHTHQRIHKTKNLFVIQKSVSYILSVTNVVVQLM